MDTVTEQKSTFRRWLYWFVPTLFYFFQTGIQALPSLTHDYVQGHYLLNDNGYSLFGLNKVRTLIYSMHMEQHIMDHLNV
ncbi:hypothetical protein [Legionella shakespearei]|uniref:Uncharacterized protein n=1 Tax=Legionella shakespearei DSM 23087 TaxID=1122169 RepID=A0A0W0YIU8_9GAMM|nr:hypothetical protein [Legionella shakespearei]KTD56435.1 hypothetical protein Lsha_2834 [Legionella shakespearei DSM 23087]